MNATPSKASIAHVAATLATVADPTKLLVDPATPGLAGVFVLFKPPHTRPTPAKLRDTFEAALNRAAPSDPAALAFHITGKDASGRVVAQGSDAFLASLPDVITPVAALGIAVRVARTKTSEWVHNGTKEGHSKWTYCDSHVRREGGARILGDATQCAECKPDGTLTIDTDVPSDIATALRTAYDEARGVVEPSRIKTLVATHLAKSGARAITDDVYLLPSTSTVNVGVIAGLIDLGGWGDTAPVADPVRIANLSSPVTLSIEEQIEKVITEAKEFVERAKAAADPKSEDMMRDSVGKTMQERIDDALRTVELWGKRLNLAGLDIAADLEPLRAQVIDEDARALAAVEERRKARKAARDAAKAAAKGVDLKAIDEEQEREERAAAAKGGAM